MSGPRDFFAGQTRSGKQRRRFVLGACLLTAAVLVSYIPAIRGGYVWDDDIYLTHNQLLTAPGGLARIWFSLDSPSQYFPLVYTTFWVEGRLWGLEPLGYHLVNVLLHAAGALLIWVLLEALGWSWGWLAAGVWALHPVQVESVAWVTERKNVLSGLFFWLALVLWLRYEGSGRRRWYWLCFGSFVVGLFAKTTLVVLPAVLMLEGWLRGRGRWRRLVEMAPFLVWGLAMAGVTIWWERHHQGTSGPEFALGPLERLLVASRAVWFYLWKLVWPLDLTFSYPRWVVNAGDARQWVFVLLCLAAGAGLWLWRSALGRGVLAAAVFFVLVLSPLLGLVMLYTFRYTWVADHYQYLACLGPLALCCGLAVRWWKWRGPPGWLGNVLAGALLVTLGTLTFRQARIYHDEESLWRDVIAKNPASWMANTNMGKMLVERGKMEEAESYYRTSINLKPDDAMAWYGLGYIRAGRERFEESIPYLEEAIRLLPKESTGLIGNAHNTLGVSYARLGRYDEAEARFRQAVELIPEDPAPYRHLGNVMMARGRTADAANRYRRALELFPDDPESHVGLGDAYARMGRYEEAREHFLRALALDPRHQGAQRNLKILDVLKKGGAGR